MTERQLHLIGWAIFLGCSGLFIVQSVRARDPWGLAASAFFAVGCVVFLAAMRGGASKG